MQEAYCYHAVVSAGHTKSEGGKGGRGVAVRAGWGGIFSQCLAPAVVGEATDVRL